MVILLAVGYVCWLIAPSRPKHARAAAMLLLGVTGAVLASGPDSALLPGAAADSARPAAGKAAVPSAAGNYLAGRFAAGQGDFGSAAALMSAALETAPGDRALVGEAFVAHLLSGRMDAARKLAPRLARTEPRGALSDADTLAHMVLLLDEAGSGAFDRAETRIAALYGRARGVFILPLLRAWSQVGQGRIDAALETVASLGTVSKILNSQTEYHAGLILDLAGRTDEAERRYRAAMDRWRLPRLVQAIGSLYERSGRPGEAETLYRERVARHGASPAWESALDRLASGAPPAGPAVENARDGMAEVFFSTAVMLFNDARSQFALGCGRLALALRPDFDLGKMNLGMMLERIGRAEDAIAVYDRIGSRSPFHWSAQLRRAVLMAESARREDAVAEFRRMAEERGDRIDALIALGDLLRRGERFAEAAAAYDSAVTRLDSVEQRHWRLFYYRGVALERSGRWKLAEKDLLRALELNPDDPYVMNYLGYSWVDQGVNLERGLELINRALALRRNDGNIVDSLGWAYYRIGRYEEAVTWLERAAELRPQDPTINDHLGDAYWRVGRRVEARAQWSRALGFDPEPGQVEDIRGKVADGLDPAEAKTVPAGAAR